MEKLLASRFARSKLHALSRGEKVEGEIVDKLNKELILDIDSKAEGVLPLRDLPKDQQESLKVGDKLSAFVIFPENESGQVTLALHPGSFGVQKYKGANWDRFQNALNKKSKLQGRVLEINKGGLIVEFEGTRGFLPNSQVGFELLLSLRTGLETLIGQRISVTVTEISADNNRLIFSQRGQVSDDISENLKSFKLKQKVKGKIVAVLPFGLVIDLPARSAGGPAGRQALRGIEGLVFISDVSWEKVENLESIYKAGQEVEAQVLGIDSELGRVNLSIKHLTDDPFQKISEKIKGDDVVKGEITDVSDAGIAVELEDGIEGFLPASKMDSNTKYSTGEKTSFLIDSVDAQRRRVNLAPFVTSTAGLIYK